MWFGLLSSGLVAVFSVVMYYAIWQTTIDGLDRELSVRAEQLLGRCSVQGDRITFDAAGADELVLDGLANLHGVEVRAWPAGQLLFHLGELQPIGDVQQPEPIDTTYTLRHRTHEQEGAVESEGEDFDDRVCELVATLPGAQTDGQLVVQIRIAADVEAIEDRLESYLIPLIAIGALFILAAIVIGRVLSSRLVGPIRDLREAAVLARGGAKTLMPLTGRGDELDDLAEVLEESFASLEKSLERQRRFTADAAHELRNPMSAITATAEVALRRDRSIETSEAMFRDILFEAKRMGEALEALLTLARCDSGDARGGFVALDLKAVVDATIQSRRRAGSAVPVSAEGSARVSGDQALLRVLFDNLLKNAERYSPADSEIRIAIEAKDRLATVLVMDQGPGIRASEHKRVFERFYRVDPEGGATGTAGLGLSIARAVVELHGGWIEVVDAEPGATIRVQIPMLGEQTQDSLGRTHGDT